MNVKSLAELQRCGDAFAAAGQAAGETLMLILTLQRELGDAGDALADARHAGADVAPAIANLRELLLDITGTFERHAAQNRNLAALCHQTAAAAAKAAR